jgi:hypothetical protein
VSTAADEGLHRIEPDELFNESWYFDFSRDDGVGGYVRLGLYPNLGVAWWWAYLMTPDRLIAVRTHDAPLPSGDALRIKAGALDANLTCVEPMQRWRLEMEATGLELEHPADGYRGEPGPKVPVSFDLTWDALGGVFDYPTGGGHAYGGHYQHAGRVEGSIRLGSEDIAFTGLGERDHSWGMRDWWAVGWHWASFQVGDALAVNLAQPALEGIGSFAIGYVARHGEPHAIGGATVDTELGAEGIPVAMRYDIDGMAVEAEVLSPAPILLVAPDGRQSRFPRALCRFSTPEGTGTGWAEWLQVPPQT